MSATAVMGGSGHAAANAVREVAPWIVKLARLGFVAKALLYMTIGVLACAAALRLGGTPGTGSRGAMATLVDAPFGHVLLVVIAIGLFGYAAWRLVQGISDPENNGNDAKGIARRVRSIGVGLVHAALGVSAIKLAWGDASAAQDGARSQDATAHALATPGGEIALWAIAGGFVAYGGYQLYKAWKAKLNKQLALGPMSSRMRRFVIGASRFGIAARGIVFGTIGVLLARAIQNHDPRQARGVKQAMLELFSFGRWPFLFVATGLIAYGVYQLINARYRRITAV
jgi:hypothetical protein